MIDLYSGSSNLGDNLSLTAAMNAFPCRIHLIDDTLVYNIAPIFYGLGEIVFDNATKDARGNPIEAKASPESNVIGPISAKILHHFRHPFASAIPKIKLLPAEIEWAKDFLKDFKNPCAFKAYVQDAKSVRNPQIEVMQAIVDKNPNTTFINFGFSKGNKKYNGVNREIKGITEINDLGVRQQAACYHVIGRYIGPDTGDYHLMLAVGGQCDVLVPSTSLEYDYFRFHYREESWKDEQPRVKYMNFTFPLNHQHSLIGLSL